MTDILDYIRDRLESSRPDLLSSVEPILTDAGHQYGGEKVYIHRPRQRILVGDSRAVAQQNGVSRRTAQRWRRQKQNDSA